MSAKMVDGIAQYLEGAWVTLDFNGTIRKPTNFEVLQCSYRDRKGILASGGRHYSIRYPKGFIRYDSLKNASLVFSFDGTVREMSECDPVPLYVDYLYLPDDLVMELQIYQSPEVKRDSGIPTTSDQL